MFLRSLCFRNLFTAVICITGTYPYASVAQKMPVIPANHLSLQGKDYQLNFIWQGDSINHTWEPHAALLLPVKLAGCDRQFYMQLDLGSPGSLFYRSQLQQIHSKYPRTSRVTDTASVLFDLQFKVGNMPIVAKEMRVIDYKSRTLNWQKKKGINIIGTIGTDFIENRVIVIDYPAQKLSNATTLPAGLASKVQLTDFMFVARAVLLPAVIMRKKTLLYFDTGSSAYALLTDKKTTELLATPGAQPIRHNTRSWDRTLTANSFASTDSIQVAFKKLPIRLVTYIEGSSQIQIEQMMKMGMGGMTGNKLFMQSILVLDTKNKKFGIVNP